MNKRLAIIFVVCLVALSLMGFSCNQKVDTITGGGFIPAKGGCGKANFGFNMQFVYDGGAQPSVTGDFQYNDKVYNGFPIPVRFHGIFDEYAYDFLNRIYWATGTYTTQPPTFNPDGTTQTGRFKVTVIDNGQPNDGGPDDFIQVKVTSGPLNGYAHFGFLKGGNIVVTYLQD